MTRMRIAAVVAAACLLVGGLTVANAAQLSVNGGSLTAAEAGPCTDSSAPITVRRLGFIYWWGVTLTNIPAPCRGKPIVVSASNNSIRGSSPSGASSSSIQIDTNGYFGNPAFTVLIDGWIVPTN